jgi:hypothetical protein
VTQLDELTLLEGVWTGEVTGTPDGGAARREYRLVIHGRFLSMTHDRDPSQPRSPNDESEEWGVFSFDAAGQSIVFREFLVEGSVNTYSCTLDPGPTSLTCRSESVQGGEALTLALRYIFSDRDHFAETFQVVDSDGTTRMEIQSRWVRSRFNAPR